ncbi:hypothetical protein NJ76_28435 [Rhodococcus sp. IITR03]|nr:hypothetical protein NJ76_28435 [Rhodococcus sp. IITR03]
MTIERTSIAAIARELGLFLFRDTVDAITVEATTGRFAADPTRLESVRVIESTSIRAHTRRALATAMSPSSWT